MQPSEIDASLQAAWTQSTLYVDKRQLAAVDMVVHPGHQSTVHPSLSRSTCWSQTKSTFCVKMDDFLGFDRFYNLCWDGTTRFAQSMVLSAVSSGVHAEFKTSYPLRIHRGYFLSETVWYSLTVTSRYSLTVSCGNSLCWALLYILDSILSYMLWVNCGNRLMLSIDTGCITGQQLSLIKVMLRSAHEDKVRSSVMEEYSLLISDLYGLGLKWYYSLK